MLNVRIAVLAICLFVSVSQAFATDRLVSRNGDDESGANPCTSPLPCRTLGQALSQAESGDVVKIATGTYRESLSLADELVVTLRGGYDRTFDEAKRVVTGKGTILTGGDNTALTIDARFVAIGVTLEGVIIKSSTFNVETQSFGFPGGGGIKAIGSFNLTLDHVTVAGNASAPSFAGGQGGGLHLEGGTTNVSNSVFEGNHAVNESGGAIAGRGASLVVTDTVFRKNVSTLGNGAAVSAVGGSYTYRRVRFEENEAIDGGFGGALWFAAGTGGTLTVENSYFLKNHASGAGGAIDFTPSGGSITIINSTLVGNTAGVDGGGALRVFQTSQFGAINATLLNVIAWGNSSAGAGQDILLIANQPNSDVAAFLTTSDIGDLAIQESPIFNAEVEVFETGLLDVDPLLDRKTSRLKPGSPMIDAGTCDGAPADDFDGDPRPTGTGLCGVDIGADEATF